MKEGQSLYNLSADLLKGMEKVFQARKYDLVLVHGDTTTAFIGALALITQRFRWDMWKQG